MEEVVDLKVETIFNLIKSSILSLEDFEEWVAHERQRSFKDGWSTAANATSDPF